MTQSWTIDGGTLKVWPHTKDPSTDDAIASTTDWEQSWDSGAAPAEAETILFDWLKDQALPNDISYKDAVRIMLDTRANEWNRV